MYQKTVATSLRSIESHIFRTCFWLFVRFLPCLPAGGSIGVVFFNESGPGRAGFRLWRRTGGVCVRQALHDETLHQQEQVGGTAQRRNGHLGRVL